MWFGNSTHTKVEQLSKFIVDNKNCLLLWEKEFKSKEKGKAKSTRSSVLDSDKLFSFMYKDRYSPKDVCLNVY